MRCRAHRAALAAHGLEVDVVLRQRGPLGPLLRERVTALWADGLLAMGSFEEDIVIVRGRRPEAALASGT